MVARLSDIGIHPSDGPPMSPYVVTVWALEGKQIGFPFAQDGSRALKM